MSANRRPYQLRLFTLRLWQEVVNGELWEWRGEVKNTSNGEVRYFRDFHLLADLLPVLLAEPDDDWLSEQHGSHQPYQPFISLEGRTKNTTLQTLEAGIYATNRAFEAAFARGDLITAVDAYTSTGQAFPPNGSALSGRSALQSFWKSVMDTGVKNVTLETIELQPCGELAYEVGKATLYGTDGNVLDTANFIVIWQQENGQWKWHRDIWNSTNSAERHAIT